MPRLRYLGKPGGQSKRDLSKLLELQMDTFGDVYENIPLCHWWFVYVGDRIAGYCALQQYNDRPDVCFLALAGVVEQFRGRGLQKRMIRHRVRFARKLGAARIITFTPSENLASANSLARCGFKLYRPEWNWADLGDILYYQRTY